MFQFRRFPSYAYLIQRRMTEYCSAGFPHSEIHGYNGYLLLPVAYRSLSRPSSAPDAKAFPLRSFQLDLLVAKSAPLRFRSRENSARSLAPRFSPKTSFRRSGTGVSVLLRVVREFLVLFENYAGLQRSKLYVTLHPFGCCSTFNLLHHAFA